MQAQLRGHQGQHGRVRPTGFRGRGHADLQLPAYRPLYPGLLRSRGHPHPNGRGPLVQKHLYQSKSRSWADWPSARPSPLEPKKNRRTDDSLLPL